MPAGLSQRRLFIPLTKVAIVGGAPSSEMAAPFHDPEYQTWVLGNRCHKYPRFDRIFEIHDDRSEHKQPDYDESLVSRNIPLIVGERFPIQAGHITVFPYKEAEKLLGHLYLTSTPAYMMAMAILEGARHIALYGCDMAVDDAEYFFQRPCLEAWIGYAKGEGIEVFIHAASPVLKATYVEGRDHGQSKGTIFTEAGFMVLANEHQRKMDECNRQIDALQRTILAHDGARQSYERMAKVARAVEAKQDIKSLKDGVVIRG